MTEFSEAPKRATSELLNTPEDVLLEMAEGVEWEVPSLIDYRDTMYANNPQLAKHAGVWVFLIRKYLVPRYGPFVGQRAEGAFNTGSLMMYELLHRVSDRTGKKVPDPKFIPNSIVDTDPTVESPQWLIDLSHRGMHLPTNHPAFFNAATNMLARSLGEDELDIKKSLFEAPVYNERSFDIVHYLSGAAEIILPIERHAQVTSLESNPNL